jgi:hypothetical protein
MTAVQRATCSLGPRLPWTSPTDKEKLSAHGARSARAASRRAGLGHERRPPQRRGLQAYRHHGSGVADPASS